MITQKFVLNRFTDFRKRRIQSSPEVRDFLYLKLSANRFCWLITYVDGYKAFLDINLRLEYAGEAYMSIIPPNENDDQLYHQSSISDERELAKVLRNLRVSPDSWNPVVPF